MRARIAAALVGMVLGCEQQPDPAPVEFAEICGEVGPVPIFDVEPWRAMEYADHLGVYGDRRLFRAYYQDASIGTTSLWSTGLCGEEPRSLLSGFYLSPFEVPAFPDLPFVCDVQTGEVHVVDPTGERAPKVVFELGSNGCAAARTDAGLAVVRPGIDETIGALILLPYPDDPFTDEVAARVLIDGVKTAVSGAPSSDAVQSDEDVLFAITVDDELVRVSVVDDSVEVVAEGILDFALSSEVDEAQDDGLSRRFLLLQRTELVNDVPEQPISELVLLDRVTSEESSLGDGWLRAQAQPFAWSNHGLMLAWILTDGELRPRFYRPPSLDYVELPANLDYQALVADDRQFVVNSSDKALALLDIETGALHRLPDGALWRWWGDQGLLSVLPDADEDHYLATSELWVLGESGKLERMAKRATLSHLFLGDLRIVSAVDIDRYKVGDLLVIDPDTLEERLIERNVYPFSASEVADDTLVYTVRERSSTDLWGVRSSVWLARLAPRD